MAGIAVAAMFQESKFGRRWEVINIKRLQGYEDKQGWIPFLSTMLGHFCSGEVLPFYFATMYWAIERVS
jgi:hypothetical protein